MDNGIDNLYVHRRIQNFLNPVTLRDLISKYFSEKDTKKLLEEFTIVVENDWGHDNLYEKLKIGNTDSNSSRLARSILFMKEEFLRDKAVEFRGIKGLTKKKPNTLEKEFLDRFIDSYVGPLRNAYGSLSREPDYNKEDIGDILLRTLFEGENTLYSLHKSLLRAEEKNIEMKKSHQNALEEINLKMEDINARLKKSEQQCRSLEENNLELLGKFEKLEEEDRVLNELLRDQFDREGYVRLVISQYNERIELESKISILEEELREKEYGTYDLRGYSGKKICVVGLRSKPTQDKLSEKLKPSKISFIDGNEDGIRQIRDGIENCDVIIYVDAGMKTHVIQQRIDSYVGDRSRMVRIHDTVNYGKILRILQEQNYRFL
jgi:hypothetical protein